MIKFENNKVSNINCPNCTPAVKLVVRTNRNNNHQFLGCPNWPDCNHTRKIPEAWIMREMGQKEMF